MSSIRRAARDRGPAVVVVLFALLATACGTTVTTGGTGIASGGLAADGITDAGAAGIAGAGGSGGLTPGGATGSTAAAAGVAGAGRTRGGAEVTGGTAAGSAATTFGGGSLSPTVNGAAPGVTSSTITIGAEYYSGADEAIAASGIKSVTTGDGRQQTQIMVDHVNKHGGVAGRKLEVVYHDYNNSGDAGEDSDLAACSKFTEDNKVFAVLSTSNSHTDNFRSCLNKRSTLLISDTSPSFDNQTLQSFPTFLPILALSLDRRITANVDGAARQRYFTPWDPRLAAPAAAGQPKIGLLSVDLPVYAKHIPQFERELKARGLVLARVARVASEADIASAVLRFSSEGITHVMFNQEGAIAGLFAIAAVNQEYYPRYAMDTKDFPQIVLDNLPAQQHKAFNGLVGIGWSPTTDVKEIPALGPEREKCLKIFSDRGVETTSNNQISLLTMLCDNFFFFDRVASLAAAALTTSSFLDAAGTIKGPQFSYFSFDLNLERHRDGIATVADLRYDVECDCIRYHRFGVPVP